MKCEVEQQRWGWAKHSHKNKIQEISINISYDDECFPTGSLEWSGAHDVCQQEEKSKLKLWKLKLEIHFFFIHNCSIYFLLFWFVDFFLLLAYHCEFFSFRVVFCTTKTTTTSENRHKIDKPSREETEKHEKYIIFLCAWKVPISDIRIHNIRNELSTCPNFSTFSPSPLTNVYNHCTMW